MSAVLLVCGNALVSGEFPDLTVRDDLRRLDVSARPGKAELAPVFGALDGGRLVVFGTDADLAAVTLRLLRGDLLAEVSVGFVPSDPRSAVAEVWGLPGEPARALELALGGEVDPVPLVRDDAGGVLVGHGEIGPVRGVGYCDDDRVLPGRTARIVVTPHPDSGLAVRVTSGRLLRRGRTAHGRAFQLGCLATVPRYDGVPHPREVTRWTWYRHTADLRLVRGLI
ncbi:MAG: hypothetical protein GEU98_20405 [Pseudonocardiaceae bacterium]|nr:hypothetical protein [Pseudonocardiaceae bacterium]